MKPQLVKIDPVRTYASIENAIKAVEKKVSNQELRYFIMTHTDGRYFPVFIGQNALTAGIHFHFNIIA